MSLSGTDMECDVEWTVSVAGENKSDGWCQ